MNRNFTLFEKILTMPINDLKHADPEISADDIEKGPSEHVLNNIFNYAKALRVVKLKQTADCNLVLN